jgi:transposase InsO family protein
MTSDIPRKVQCIDDALLWDKNIEDSFWHTVDYLIHCSKNGVVFNPSKFRFSQPELDFAGFCLTADGIKPSKSLLDAISSFPKPTKLTDARSWFGLVNQVAFGLSSSKAMQPFRDLLKPGSWYWDETLDRAFEESKTAILNMVRNGVRAYEHNRPTCLCTDWSKEGLGFTLLQKHCRCQMSKAPYCCKDGWHLIFAGSRFTTSAESRYSPCEGEALAVAYALEKCRMFVLGCTDLTIATDHKPLVKILGDGNMDSIKNPRLFNIKERTLRFDYTIKHVPGAGHHAPDAFSRQRRSPKASSLSCLTTAEELSDDDTSSTACAIAEACTHSALSALFNMDGPTKAITIQRIKDAASRDQSYTALLQLCQSGFPVDASTLNNSLRPYWKIHKDLYVVDNVVMYGERIVVPSALRREILECLHAAHQGVAGMKARAATCVYWPGISADISNRRAHCRTCNSIAPSQPRLPLHPPATPTYPFEQVVADYFTLHGHDYLVYADRYTGWVTVAKGPSTGNTAAALIQELRTAFTLYGAPVELSTDGGPQFSSQSTQSFLRNWGVKWRVSSAHYPQSNGRAELAVKTAKRLLRDNISPNGDLNTDTAARALLQYRNTPLQDIGVSPAQLLYGRRLRDHLPSFADVLKIRPEWIQLAEDRERALSLRHMRAQESYNHRTRHLPGLEVGNCVLVQNQYGNYPNRWDKTGRIVEVHPNDQYLIRMDGSGRCTLRNRRFLRRCSPFMSDSREQLPVEISKIPEHITEDQTSTETADTGPILPYISDETDQPQVTNSLPPASTPPVIPRTPARPITSSVPPLPAAPTQTQEQETLDPEPSTSEPQPPRRSTRQRLPRQLISMTMTGKHHNTCRPCPTSGLKVVH